ncbi:hypothetical protein BJ165DRAFT_1457936 [Panaeolus papilionaceus]|nr:hypothetical protein BJ165DRAFT_1457936 [Panaeolus papilionaceus]
MQAKGEMMEEEGRLAMEAAMEAEIIRREMEEMERAAREEEKRAREEAERAERYEKALKVVKEEQERHQREGKDILGWSAPGNFGRCPIGDSEEMVLPPASPSWASPPSPSAVPASPPWSSSPLLSLPPASSPWPSPAPSIVIAPSPSPPRTVWVETKKNQKAKKGSEGVSTPAGDASACLVC